ncbi:hypothetical protein PPTG_21409 [Phytophthora nicotianae INRA-310]|uniref:Uncharacterized protein n=1 Tax=Phytophthora nicotianae (strain INRA-310) TaxID=761204 RepID=W2R178_PHYN3|nr:hypothetical protein PPTG_21409 [Phytophthora nicotianae INRA-310]ETN19103.1 hypothetical protein PPTG_21409 [Phytophthora nicotianae INRA-310]
MTKTRSTTNVPEDNCRDTMPIFTPVLSPRLSSTSHVLLVK